MHLLVALIACPLAATAAAVAANPDTDRKAAERSLLQGRLDESVAALRQLLAANPDDGPTQLLLCRAMYAAEDADEAITACEHALHTLNTSSEAQDWMGRAYGMKASRSGPLVGLRLAHKVRSSFETAVELDPTNPDAVNDLGDYYVNAPGIVGGGTDKAAALATRVASRLPEQAHRLHALAAEQDKDYGTAEREFRAAVDVAGRPNAWADLGAFQGRRRAYDKAVDALQHCLAADRSKDASTVDAAAILIEIHREPRLADQALRQYLVGRARSDAAPAPRVQVLLAQLRSDAGDKAGAKIELDKALQLASKYPPATRALLALQKQE